MTPLTTPIFDFHYVMNAFTTPLTIPTPTPSQVKTSLLDLHRASHRLYPFLIKSMIVLRALQFRAAISALGQYPAL